MKNFLLFISPLFILFFTGCASTKNSSDKTKIQIIEATYHSWTDKLPNTSLPENGADLQLTLSNWPQEYAPVYIIFHNYKSNSATLADSTGNNVKIRARIIRTSGVLAKTSSKTNISDRLVFTTASGDTGFIEIEEWEKVEK